MNAKSRIKKGKDFENKVCEAIEQEGLGRSVRTPGSGSGKIKGDIFNSLPFMIEAKNQRVLKIPEWIRQAKEQAEIGNEDRDKWCLVFKETSSPDCNPEMIAVLDFHELLKLLKKDSEPRIKEPDRDLKWKLEKLKGAIQQVMRDL